MKKMMLAFAMLLCLCFMACTENSLISDEDLELLTVGDQDEDEVNPNN